MDDNEHEATRQPSTTFGQTNDGKGQLTTHLNFWHRKKSVLPSDTRDTRAPNPIVPDANDDDQVFFHNISHEFDLTAFCHRAISAITKKKSNAVVDSKTTEPTAAPNSHKNHRHRHRLRGSEELCLLLPKTTTRPKKACFLRAGYIGREAGEYTILATKDPSMDVIHAQVTMDRDDYLLQDQSSNGGTYLCLSTTNRHHPQRDGFRLRNGDIFLVGNAVKVEINKLSTIPSMCTNNGRAEEHQIRPIEQSLTGLNVIHRRLQSGELCDHNNNSKKVRFADPFTTAPADGLPHKRGPYRRPNRIKKEDPYPAHDPHSISLTISIAEQVTSLELPGKGRYLIGSSPACDIHVTAEDICPVHARIIFDGFFFVLQDLSFENNPTHMIRIPLTQPTRISRGDCLLFGTCIAFVVSVHRAFPSQEPNMREVAFQCHLLRPSKRKSRSKGKYIPVGFRHHLHDAVTFGKAPSCEAPIFTASLCVEQFTIQLQQGGCTLFPKATGINQGLYLLLGRNCLLHEEIAKPDLIRPTSRALMLTDGSIFKCGNSELEVIYIKPDNPHNNIEEELENTKYLQNMPWIQQIAFDHAALRNLAQRGQRLYLEPGDLIYNEGDTALFFFIVISGEVALTSSRNDVPLSFRLSMFGGSMSSITNPAASLDPVTEKVMAGSYFGEISLLHEDQTEYGEIAKSSAQTTLLVLSRDDICGYLSHYMDIIYPHFAYEAHKELLQKLRLHVKAFRSLSYQELRILAAKVERLSYQKGQDLNTDGFFRVSGTQCRTGIMMLGFGTVLITKKVAAEGNDEGEIVEHDELWKPNEPITILPEMSMHSGVVKMTAHSRVGCFFLDSIHLLHINLSDHAGDNFEEEDDAQNKSDISSLRRQSTHRRRSSVETLTRSSRHSQVIKMNRDKNNADDHPGSLESAILDEINDPMIKWRRKKRNKSLLAKTVLETQLNPDFHNAAVIYVLSGANRGDIHVVRNVTSIGGILSGADIELNDRYVSDHHAVIQYRDGQYWLYDNLSEWGTYVRLDENEHVQALPGDIFLAGEVEFKCFGAFPEQKPGSKCCIQ